MKKNILLLTLLSAGSFVFAQQDNIASRIDSVMKQYDMAGLSVAVVKKGELIYTHSFGFKNLETQAPLKDTDIFRIASISKSFWARPLCNWLKQKN